MEPGYETALGAALGEDIDAPADEGAPVHWRGLPPLPKRRSRCRAGRRHFHFSYGPFCLAAAPVAYWRCVESRRPGAAIAAQARATPVSAAKATYGAGTDLHRQVMRLRPRPSAWRNGTGWPDLKSRCRLRCRPPRYQARIRSSANKCRGWGQGRA